MKVFTYSEARQNLAKLLKNRRSTCDSRRTALAAERAAAEVIPSVKRMTNSVDSWIVQLPLSCRIAVAF